MSSGECRHGMRVRRAAAACACGQREMTPWDHRCRVWVYRRRRFSEHVGDIPTRASFAPHVGRIKPPGVKMDDTASPARLSAVPETGGSSGSGAGSDAGAGGGRGVHARNASSPAYVTPTEPRSCATSTRCVHSPLLRVTVLLYITPLVPGHSPLPPSPGWGVPRRSQVAATSAAAVRQALSRPHACRREVRQPGRRRQVARPTSWASWDGRWPHGRQRGTSRMSLAAAVRQNAAARAAPRLCLCRGTRAP